MKKEKTGTIDYDFNTLNPTDYELEISFPAEHRTMALAYKSSIFLLKRKGQDVKYNKLGFKEVDIPPQYLNLVKGYSSGMFKQLQQELQEDKITILDWRVLSAKIAKREKDYLIKIKYAGHYAK